MAPTVAADAPAAATGAKQQHTGKAAALAARDASGLLAPLTITRRSTGDDDVAIKILYCGICHSDLHSIKNERHNAMYPMVPGHEIAGVVTEVGKNVTKFKAGDRVGVGCVVNSCHSCDSCKEDFENHCPGKIFTYNSTDRDGTVTYGGYSSNVVVHERFVVRFPDAMPLDQGAPLLCAGITVYSPMKYHGLNVPGKHVGVVGLGGLGHVAVKFAKAFGLKVTVISSSPAKKQEALERLGADAFIVSKNADEMKAVAATMDGIINTVSANTPLAPFMGLLKPNGKMIMVGLPEKSLEIPPFDLIMGNKTLAGSCIGGMRDTQEMIDVAAKHGALPWSVSPRPTSGTASSSTSATPSRARTDHVHLTLATQFDLLAASTACLGYMYCSLLHSPIFIVQVQKMLYTSTKVRKISLCWCREDAI